MSLRFMISNYHAVVADHLPELARAICAGANSPALTQGKNNRSVGGLSVKSLTGCGVEFELHAFDQNRAQ